MNSWRAYKIQAEMIVRSQVLSKVVKAELLDELKSKLTGRELREFREWIDNTAKYYILEEDYEKLSSEAKV